MRARTRAGRRGAGPCVQRGLGRLNKRQARAQRTQLPSARAALRGHRLRRTLACCYARARARTRAGPAFGFAGRAVSGHVARP